jgi:hypothetical protein
MGALPKGYTIDDLLTLPQAAQWLDVSPSWLRKRARVLPGVVIESAKVKRFHPRSYLERRARR